MDNYEFQRQIDNVRITDDLVFRNVIEKDDNCLHLLQVLFPQLGIKQVYFETQKHAKLDKQFKLQTGAQIVVINSQGSKGTISNSLQDFISLMNGKIKTTDKFINKLQKDMEYLKHDPEWRKNYMNLEMKLRDVRDEAAEKAERRGLKILFKTLKDMGISDDGIFAKLKQNYGKYFSDEEIHKYMD